MSVYRGEERAAVERAFDPEGVAVEALRGVLRDGRPRVMPIVWDGKAVFLVLQIVREIPKGAPK